MHRAQPEIEPASLNGKISFMRERRVLKFLSAVTGLLSVKIILIFLLRYFAGYAKKGKIEVTKEEVLLYGKLYLFGKQIRKFEKKIPTSRLKRLEKDYHYKNLTLLSAAGGLVSGVLIAFICLVEWSFSMLGIYIISFFLFIILGITFEILGSIIIPHLKGETALGIVYRMGLRKRCFKVVGRQGCV